jgi:mannose-6-phosphate isomerase-like protein (cupin superfamily)
MIENRHIHLYDVLDQRFPRGKINMSHPQYVPAAKQPEFWTDERCFITEVCNTDLLQNASLAIARVEPGVTTQLHSLTDLCETYIVIEGSGEMELDGAQFPIAAGDQVVIPAGMTQRVTANGDVDLRFHCLCVPRFTPDAYVNLES